MRIHLIALALVAATAPACRRDEPEEPELGFQAAFDVPDPAAPDVTLDHGPVAWLEGPHAGFDEIDLASAARDSIAWFEGSPDAARWRGIGTLELVYPCQELRVTARYAPGIELSWEQQLRAWFACFPPGGPGGTGIDSVEHYPWHFELGARGRVDSVAGTSARAIEAMRARLVDGSSFLGDATLVLEVTHRLSSHEMNCWSVETTDPTELDALPARLASKRAKTEH